ncbi:MAG TPA: hypothetical protein VM286_05845 [Candidatus Thermoplasmatota archaeon]|nr:hypothetical protein [Candidatus Thermoplasmatota archaeon]
MGSFLGIANPLDPGTYRWVAPATERAVLVLSGTEALYALGGALNAATGGKTKTYDAYDALHKGGAIGTRYSTTTQALSGYQGTTPGQGEWRLPVLNPATAKLGGEVTASVIDGFGGPVADALSKSLFGVKLRTLAWITGGTVVGLGALYVVRSTPQSNRR